jgi:hypothetical protein
MTLELNNKRVIDFYKKNKHISFEEVNVFMVDMLEKIMQSDHSPNLLNEMNKTLLCLQTKMESMTKDISKIHNDTQNNLILKMMEMKDIYMDQLKSALTNNVSEKIQPILKEHTGIFLDKTKLLLNDLIPKNQEHMKTELKDSLQRFETSIMKEKYNPQELTSFIQNLETKFNQSVIETNDKLLRSDHKLESGFKEMRELTNTNQQNMSLILNKMENSSSKGKISENILFHILQGLYPSASIDSVGTQKETGDVMFSRRDKQTILIENKNWDKNVLQAEVQKFIRDCETQQCSGLFLSQNCGICNKDNFEIDIHDGNVLLYIHNVNYDKEIIKVGIDIIDHFKMNLDKINDKVDVNTIKKDVLDTIHKEYNNYRIQKETLQKMIKDTQGKLLRQVDELKMPDLENYLSMYYSFSAGKFTCQYCGFISEKKAGLSAHERGCKIKKEMND